MKPKRTLKNTKAWEVEGISDGMLKLLKEIKGKTKNADELELSKEKYI